MPTASLPSPSTPRRRHQRRRRCVSEAARRLDPGRGTAEPSAECRARMVRDGYARHARWASAARAAELDGATSAFGAAIDRLSTRAPHAALYLGAGDGPRLGYGALARRLAVDASRLGLGRTRSVRGFATNIGSYQPVGAACKLDDDGSLARWCRERAHEDCCSDGCHLVSAYNSGNNALNYTA